jgi:hypothetical protein
LAKEYAGMAALKADPFMKFNNSMEILKEKLGNAILPLITQFVDQISKPGGLVDQVGKFLDDLSNPKTDAGKLFTNLKDAVKGAVDQVKNFFAAFGGGDAMKGFSNVVSGLIRSLPALLALKGILILANTAKAIRNLVVAVSLIRGKDSLPGTGTGSPTPVGKLGNMAKFGTLAAILSLSGDTTIETDAQKAKRLAGIKAENARRVAGAKLESDKANNFMKLLNTPNSGGTVNNVTIHVHSADPKAVVDAVSQYVKKNGKVPTAWKVSTGGH